jgi:hypothetical protein
MLATSIPEGEQRATVAVDGRGNPLSAADDPLESGYVPLAAANPARQRALDADGQEAEDDDDEWDDEAEAGDEAYEEYDEARGNGDEWDLEAESKDARTREGAVEGDDEDSEDDDAGGRFAGFTQVLDLHMRLEGPSLDRHCINALEFDDNEDDGDLEIDAFERAHGLGTSRNPPEAPLKSAAGPAPHAAAKDPFVPRLIHVTPDSDFTQGDIPIASLDFLACGDSCWF